MVSYEFKKNFIEGARNLQWDGSVLKVFISKNGNYLDSSFELCKVRMFDDEFCCFIRLKVRRFINEDGGYWLTQYPEEECFIARNRTLDSCYEEAFDWMCEMFDFDEEGIEYSL